MPFRSQGESHFLAFGITADKITPRRFITVAFAIASVTLVNKRRSKIRSLRIVRAQMKTLNGVSFYVTGKHSPPLIFLSEFNHARNSAGVCVLVDGAEPLPSDDSCPRGEDYWYERTAYRKIAYSSCEGGKRPDRGTSHACPGLKGHGFFFWVFVLFVPVTMAGLVGYWFYRRSGLARGCVIFPSISSSAFEY